MSEFRKPFERCSLEKAPAITDPRYGIPPEQRPIREHLEHGVVTIDKPAGPTSHEVVAWIRVMLELNKAAHTGTLDPKVTGVLPVLLGTATKLAEIFVGDKEYVCVMRVHRPVDESRLRAVSAEFVGEIYQRPPLKSAVRRRIRKRTVHYLEVMEIAGKEVLVTVGCEAGTYIRMLCHHLGLALGVGAHMAELRRTKSFPFSEERLTTLHDLKDAYVFYQAGDERLLRQLIMPLEDAVRHLRCIMVKDSAVDALAHGADLSAPGIARLEEGINRGDSVIVYTLKGEAVSLGEAVLNSREMLKAEKGICVETRKVLMKPGTYPKGWRSKAEVAER
ncbi:MAG TPA: RNA-guided pseudouridylation complex pseudouridine synthase subunit Cbf5 [Methanomicrobia archaeon]|nr:RNA-guided pseudouridylation complex pseudouridine synthase subunit Cbf5 [Methanomicrobia archaeon]